MKTFKKNDAFFPGKIKEKIVFALMVGAGIFLFYSFIYSDILITSRHGINLWECLFTGNIGNFYEYNSVAKVESYAFYMELGAFYDFPVYIIFAIWNIPMYVVEKNSDINLFQSLPCLMYMKTILIVFSIGTLTAMRKIAQLCGVTRERLFLLSIMFLTSVLYVSSVVIISQYDIIAICFMMWGLFFYMQKKMKLFHIFFAVAVPIKFFAFFMYIGLILYKEKNLLKDLFYIVIPFLPIGFFRVCIPFFEMSNDEVGFRHLFSNGIPVSTGSAVPLFIIFLVMFYAVCYIRQWQGNQEKAFYRETIETGFWIYTIIFGCSKAFPYWIMYWLPFLLLVLLLGKAELFKVNLLLEMICSISYILVHTAGSGGLYGARVAGDMLFARMLHSFGRVSVYKDMFNLYGTFEEHVSEKLTMDFFINIFTGVWIGSLLLFLFFNFVRKENNIELETETSAKIYIYMHIATGYILGGVPIVWYIVSMFPG